MTTAQACPVLIQLTEADSVDDYRTEAVALIAKMAPLIGKENAEKIFLERYCFTGLPALNVNYIPKLL